MIAAVVLAAGQSRRMGSPKMILPWEETTVIGKVVSTLFQAEIAPIVVITGGAHLEVEAALQAQSVQVVFNPQYAQGEMLSSVQVGLSALPDNVGAALIVLGDQPQIEADVVSRLIKEYQTTGSKVIVPSYQMHRGHPWLIDRSLWRTVNELRHPDTLRDFLNTHASFIHYLVVDTPSVIEDIDTPEEYLMSLPKKL
jgi:molybdenum cofactor cytidylyltransferase